MRKSRETGLSLLASVAIGATFGFFVPASTLVSAGTEDETPGIVVRGSTNLRPFVDLWIDTYQKTSSTPGFDIQSFGTSGGIAELVAGRAHIAMATRSMTDEEQLAAGKNGLKIRETVVARVGIAVIVNKENTVQSLTIKNLAAIFSGASGNWLSFGGPDKPISVVRKESGWSPAIFKQRILGDAEFSDDAIIVDSKEEIVIEVGSRLWAIGFTGTPEAFPALDRVNLIRIVDESSEGDATYALSRPYYFYSIEGKASVDSFLKFVTGPEAQGLIVDTGFFPAKQADDNPSD